MKLKPTTFVLIFLALVLGGVAYLAKDQSLPQAGQTQDETKPIFGFEEQQAQALTLKTGGKTYAFTKDKNGVWQMTEPEKAVANDASVAFLMNLLATGTSQRSLTAPASDKKSFGLEEPLATIEVKLNNQTTHTLVVGSKNFNETALYALADPKPNASELNLRLVSLDFENAVSRPLAEWKDSEEASPAPESPAPESPAAESPASESPAPESPAAESPSPSPAAESPAPESPTPSASPESPAAESPSPSPSP